MKERLLSGCFHITSAFVLMLVIASQAQAATITVDSLLDGAVDLTDNVVTLRDAIEAANNDVAVSPGETAGSGADTIQFANSLNGGTITLTQGELRVTEALTIQGLGAAQLTISGGNNSRLFVLGGNGAQTYTINDITLADGNGAGANERRGGGAIQMFGDRDDILNINRSVLRNMQTNNRVGAAISLVFGTLNVTDSAVVNNGSGQGTIYLQDSTSTLTSSTLSGNASSFGSIWGRSGFGTVNLTLLNTTIANNNVGVFYSSERVNATTNVSYRNSIFSGNGTSFQVGGATGTIALTSLGNNILSDATGDATPEASDQLNTNALISSLTQVGASFIHQLLPGSPAIDTADASAPANDQIGLARRDGDLNGSVVADRGAAEYTSFVVTTAQDVVDASDELMSLREAITLANAAGGADTILFDNSLNGETVTLTQGELRVTEALTIQGLGAAQLTISGGNNSRLFVLGGNGAQTYTINDITLADGNGAGANERRGGGAIQMFGDRDDILNINRSVLRNMQTNNRVGAAISLVFGTLNVTDSAVVNNGSGQGTIYLQDSTSTLTSSTLSGNASSFGSIWGRSGFGTVNLTLLNTTIANNNVGVFYSSERVNATTNVSYRNSIFSGNGTSFQVGGATGTIALTSLGNNILSDATGDATPEASDQLNTNAGIDLLTQVNGTFVHRILPGSVAIDAGDHAAAPALDQRGQARVDGDSEGTITADIGAFEFTNVAPVISAQSFSANENQTSVGAVIATDADLPNDTLSFTIAGTGSDDALFSMSASGVLSFVNPPNFEAPVDQGGTPNDNVYEVAVTVSDLTGATATQTISVTVVDVDDLDTDGDGAIDTNDGCPQDSSKIAPGTCGCGVADTDSDGDGTSDCNDTCSADPNKISAGICGCGVVDSDTDGDGTADCIDFCVNDANKTVAGTCGCGVPDTDSDGDDIADCNEAFGDPFNDGDGDGILNGVDNCPEVANPAQEDTDGVPPGDACDIGIQSIQPLNLDIDGDGGLEIGTFKPNGGAHSFILSGAEIQSFASRDIVPSRKGKPFYADLEGKGKTNVGVVLVVGKTLQWVYLDETGAEQILEFGKRGDTAITNCRFIASSGPSQLAVITRKRQFTIRQSDSSVISAQLRFGSKNKILSAFCPDARNGNRHLALLLKRSITITTNNGTKKKKHQHTLMIFDAISGERLIRKRLARKIRGIAGEVDSVGNGLKKLALHTKRKILTLEAGKLVPLSFSEELGRFNEVTVGQLQLTRDGQVVTEEVVLTYSRKRDTFQVLSVPQLAKVDILLPGDRTVAKRKQRLMKTVGVIKAK